MVNRHAGGAGSPRLGDREHLDLDTAPSHPRDLGLDVRLRELRVVVAVDQHLEVALVVRPIPG